MRFVLNTILSALLIAGAAEAGKRSVFAAALLVSLPVTSILALSFLFVETHDAEKVAAFSMGIFWLVLPTLLFFLALAALLRGGWGYWVAMPAAAAAMVGIFWAYSILLERLGIRF